MKKYILGLLIATTSIISFSSANFTFTSFYDEEEDIVGYSPNPTIANNFYLNSESIVSYTCPSNYCSLCMITEFENNCVELKNGNLVFSNPNIELSSFVENYAVNTEGEWTDNINNYFSSITLKTTSNSAICKEENATFDDDEGYICNGYTGEEEGGEGGEGGVIGGSIIAGGTEQFSGIITKLGSIFGEFGQYMIYIAIACLGVSLLFKALKYILGFTNNQSKNSISGRGTMQERRRRRRQQRRRTYSPDEARNDRKNYYISKGYKKGYKRRSWKVQNGRIKNNGGF